MAHQSRPPGGRGVAASASHIRLSSSRTAQPAHSAPLASKPRKVITRQLFPKSITRPSKTMTNMHDAIETVVFAINAVLGANPHLLHQGNTAFVFDIDDTIVFPLSDDYEEGIHPCKEGTPKLRKLMKRLVKACQRFGRVFYVTAREARRDVAEFTDKELREAGFGGWEEVFYCPREKRGNWYDISDFKRNARRAIERMVDEKTKKPLGFKVILAAGDKWSDAIASTKTPQLDRKEAGKPWFTITPVIDPKQHTMLALKLPSRK